MYRHDTETVKSYQKTLSNLPFFVTDLPIPWMILGFPMSRNHGIFKTWFNAKLRIYSIHINFLFDSCIQWKSSGIFFRHCQGPIQHSKNFQVPSGLFTESATTYPGGLKKYTSWRRTSLTWHATRWWWNCWNGSDSTLRYDGYLRLRTAPSKAKKWEITFI